MSLTPKDRIARSNLFKLAANYLETRQEEMSDEEIDNSWYVIEQLYAASNRWDPLSSIRIRK